jgi:hypothetical protein
VADQGDLPCPVLLAKKFRFAFAPNRTYNSAIPPFHKGRFAIVTDVGRGAVDADGAEDERRLRRTAKSCGPAGVKLAENFPEVTVTRKPDSPGRARRKPLKPLRRECRVMPATRGF